MIKFGKTMGELMLEDAIRLEKRRRILQLLRIGAYAVFIIAGLFYILVGVARW